ncbi:MAG: leucine--tRNA ligase [Candidatus Doudnabacteria bacterium]|nr:leucine--tRNA ligase [Candidatus Doudnabacteria bacterium]
MYDHKSIEKKWQTKWLESQLYRASDDSVKPKKYILMEFPYPSGEGLHMGHLRGYTAGDTYSRYLRMNGYEVMYPIGWDAFGLPAENFAIKNGIHPSIATAKNIENAKRQFQSWGMGFDWSREINTTDPEYYKWTQWIFLQFLKAGLAFQATGIINWCPKDKTGLANEEVIDGRCERCGTLVEKREMKQWYLKITAYAQKLLDGLKDLDWPESVKLQQENWIGRSVGAQIKFPPVSGGQESVEVFTTRPDTLFGATYIVLAPDHPMVLKITTEDQKSAVEIYASEAITKTEIERTALDKEKTGVFTGAYAINPGTEEEIPIWVADYVLSNYGTGAIMAVPAHDQRDNEFAKKYNIPIRKVVAPPVGVEVRESEVYTGNGTLINSGEYNFMPVDEAQKHITADFGKPKIQYKLRDWVFSRQRYWGEPIPVVHCEKCGVVAVPEDQLPVVLPEVEKYEPTGSGESPLALIESWVNTTCSKCHGPAKRETNTMPQWAGSSWYFLRYADPNNGKEMASKEKLKHWQPVDVYFGGMEHTTLHLLYSRFWNQFLFDQGHVTVSEPYVKRVPHGIVLASDGEKMSKSREGSVVNPDIIVESHGADALRMYEMFLGPHDSSVSWNDNGVVGVRRFLERLYGLKPNDSESDKPAIHKLIKKISEDILDTKFNTSVAAFMEFLNNNPSLNKNDLECILKLLAPFAPHITEEIWSNLGNSESIHSQVWPKYDESKIAESEATVVVQVMGKLRATLKVKTGLEQEEIKRLALADQNVANHISGKEIVKEIFVQDRLINFVVK